MLDFKLLEILQVHPEEVCVQLQIMADVMGAEAGLVRMQLVSGTHAIATALFACLRPGDTMLAVAGRCAFPASSLTHSRAVSKSICIDVPEGVALRGPHSCRIGDNTFLLINLLNVEGWGIAE